MGDVLILGGTSEGRELAEYAGKRGIPVLITVVSEYGEHLLCRDTQEELPETAPGAGENGPVRVHQGILDEGGMERLLSEESPKLVLDATHPYARKVTETAVAVCGRLGIPYRRVLREAQQTEGNACYEVSSAGEAAAFLAHTKGGVFLTTGSKELGVFAAVPGLRERLYARVLPDSGVLQECEALGVRGKHLIAMQGPFSVEMNTAMLRETGVSWMVTKESGSRGGFAEKLAAAAACQVSTVVIRRPIQEEGISLQAAMRLLDPAGPADLALRRRVTLVGIGMGGGAHLTRESLDALAGCDALLGAPRMLETAETFTGDIPKVPYYQAERILEWLREHSDCRNAVVAYSGDTGFYSGSEPLAARLCETDFEVRICPGISSAAALAARLGCGWEDWHLASAHGREADPVLLLEEYEKVFLLLGGVQTVRTLCRRMVSGGWGSARVTVGIRLGYPQEQVLRGTAASFSDDPGDDKLSCVLFERAERK